MNGNVLGVEQCNQASKLLWYIVISLLNYVQIVTFNYNIMKIKTIWELKTYIITNQLKDSMEINCELEFARLNIENWILQITPR